jgi:hypothetical protein
MLRLRTSRQSNRVQYSGYIHARHKAPCATRCTVYASRPMTPELSSDAVADLVGPSPCDGCAHRRRCARQLLACRAFILFAKLAPEPEWQTAPHEPTARIFAKVYRTTSEDDAQDFRPRYGGRGWDPEAARIALMECCEIPDGIEVLNEPVGPGTEAEQAGVSAPA